MLKLILASFCIAVLMGCHHPGASVTFTPSALKDCGVNNAPSTVEVHWDATQGKPKNGVKLWISNGKIAEGTGNSDGSPGTLWLQGGDTGSSVTGAWMYPGTTIVVTDANNDEVMATAKVPSSPCK